METISNNTVLILEQKRTCNLLTLCVIFVKCCYLVKFNISSYIAVPVCLSDSLPIYVPACFFLRLSVVSYFHELTLDTCHKYDYHDL